MDYKGMAYKLANGEARERHQDGLVKKVLAMNL